MFLKLTILEQKSRSKINAIEECLELVLQPRFFLKEGEVFKYEFAPVSLCIGDCVENLDFMALEINGKHMRLFLFWTLEDGGHGEDSFTVNSVEVLQDFPEPKMC